MKNLSLSMSLLAVAGVLSASNLAHAEVGRIISGSAGWNMDNVKTVYLDADGNPTATLAEDGVYISDVYDGDPATAELMGSVVAKNPPVGEPPGVKVVNGPDGSEKNCLISTAFLDKNAGNEDEPDYVADYSEKDPVTCTSPFQSHKRYKVLMLPETVDGVGAESVDMVFNVENDTTSTVTSIPYTVYQKINNWTDSRLQGYKLELGFGVGDNFTVATDASLTFNNDKDSAFSHGLFGPIEEGKFPENGFFSTELAGYTASGEGLNTFTADTAIGEYSDILGSWLPAAWAPYGIFFDDDGDPATDAQLMAWWGKGTDGTYKWMYGQLEHYTEINLPEGMTTDFAPVPAEQVLEWLPETITEGEVNLYSIDHIDDFGNLNLNYTVNIGAIGTWPAENFTIRVTPTKNDGAAPEYTLAANLPPQLGVVPDVVPVVVPADDDNDGIFGIGSFNLPLFALFLGLLGLTRIRKKAQ